MSGPGGGLALSLEPPLPASASSRPSHDGAGAVSEYIGIPDAVSGTSGSAHSATAARQRRLIEVGVTGELMYESAQQADPPLSTQLLKLWGERGDFSKFSSSNLKIGDDESAEDGAKGDSDSIGDDSDDEGEAGAPADGEGTAAGGGPSASAHEAASSMTIPQMIDLKERMLSQLTAAQHAVHFSNMLLSLLIAGAKPAPSAAAAAAAAGGAAGSRAVSRAGSPDPHEAGKAGSSVGHGGGGMGGGPGGAADGGWGLDASVLGLTRITLKDDPSDARGAERGSGGGGGGGGGGGAPPDDDQDRAPPAKVNALKTDAEIARERALALGMQRDGIASAVSILRRGALQIREAIGAPAPAATDEANGSDSAEDAPRKRPSRTALAERIRWEGLRRLKSGGGRSAPAGAPRSGEDGASTTVSAQAWSGAWGVRGGKPIEIEVRRKPGLLVQGMPNVNKAEEARDAWIGWGVPESHPRYRRATLAYFAAEAVPDPDGDGDEDDGLDLPDNPAEIPDHVIARHIVIPDRPNKRLRVVFRLRGGASASANPTAKEAGADDMDVDGGASGDEAERAANSDLILCSEAPDSDARPRAKDLTLDGVLQAAVDEIADVELFDEITRQARQLAGTYDMSISTDSVELSLTPEVTLSYQLRSTAAGTLSSAASGASNEPAENTVYSPIAAAVCACARLALVEKYKRVAQATRAADPAGSSTSSAPLDTSAQVLAPIIGLISYCRAASALQTSLSEVLAGFPECALVYEPFASLQDAHKWLSSFISGNERARTYLCGNATVLRAPRAPKPASDSDEAASVAALKRTAAAGPQMPVAIVELRFPADASVEFPLKTSTDPLVPGVRLDHVGADKVAAFLREELTRLRAEP